MSNLKVVLDALVQLKNKSGNNYRSKYYYADMRNKLNSIEHCRYNNGSVDYVYRLEFIDSNPIIMIGLNNRKDFIFPNTFIHEGVTYKVTVVRPVSY